jgi:hypothetical protein
MRPTPAQRRSGSNYVGSSTAERGASFTVRRDGCAVDGMMKTL